MDDKFNEAADELMKQKRWAEARDLLEKAIAGMPGGWTLIREDGKSLVGAFWDLKELLSYSKHRPPSKTLLWIPGSYSQAWYQLAVIAVEEERLDNALLCIDSAIAIEADHPDLWCEKALILNRLKRHDEALHLYESAITIRPWALRSQVARALRGQGATLIDLDRLDEAEAAFLKSQELEPDSPVAKHELAHIAEARKRRADPDSGLSWFVRAIVNPPTDPLTIQLLALVENLESIPGPQTVGAKNYPKIMRAFMERGWAGFEEAFDRIVPRTRLDYTDVKRDLLREAIFNPEAHRNLSRALTGQADIEEILKEVRREKDNIKKPH